MAFRFEKPFRMDIKAGEYLDMTLLDPSEQMPKEMCAVFRLQAPLTKRP